jgi:hypothetical protein
VWIKIVILVIFLGIVLSLASGLMFLVKDKGDSRRTLRALSIRIGLSVGLFAFLMILVALGVIKPHAVLPSMPPTTNVDTTNQ